MNAAEREHLLDQAGERITALIWDCYLQVEAIRAEAEELTGMPVKDPGAASRPAPYTDLDLSAVREVQRRCGAFMEASDLLVPLLEAAPHRTVGAVLKTADVSVTARIRAGLQTCEFFLRRPGEHSGW